jgi:hypothetical protein
VNQILAKGLHNADSEAFNYTMALMDKLEKIKADNATNDAIIDDTAGQAYVEHFGLETFFRADRAVKANRVTKYDDSISTQEQAYNIAGRQQILFRLRRLFSSL